MGQPLSRGIQREIGTSALRLAESGRREGRIARGEGAWRKRFLYERIWRASSFVLERTACTCPILVLYSLSRCISISSHREIFSRANDLILYFFSFSFFRRIHLFSILFCRHLRKTRRSPRGRLSIAALIASPVADKSAPLYA